jgi:hypothetical protein
MNKEDHNKCREDKQVILFEHFLDRGVSVTFFLTKQTDWTKMSLFFHICKSLLHYIPAAIHAHSRLQSYFSPD